MDTAVTGRDGRYHFSSFNETGDYQVRVVLPSRFTTAQTTRDVLISRGGLTISGINFGLAVAGRTLSAVAADTTPTSTSATDAALTTMDSSSFTSPFGSSRTRFNRIPR
jgi:hypothetical protein